MTTNKNKTILSLLKESTQANHDATEVVGLSNKIATGTLSLIEYQNLLACNWNIHRYLISSFSDVLDIKPSPDIQNFIDNKKLQWLEADLEELDFPISKIDVDPKQLPKYLSIPAVIGGLYVVEGSMLGGQFICRRLRENKQLQAISRFRFYNSYGQKLGKRWTAFKQLAIQEINTTNATEVCIAAAKETFIFFEASYTTGFERIK